jgi:hypothetical protein
MKTTPLAQSPPSSCSDSSLSHAVKALNTTLKNHAEERTKELEIQLLKLEVTDLELQMLTLARKLRTAKEKLIAHYTAETPQESDPAEPFERRLAKAITASGKAKGELAAACGVALSTVSRWLGGTIPQTETLVKISRFLGVSETWLLGSDQNA